MSSSRSVLRETASPPPRDNDRPAPYQPEIAFSLPVNGFVGALSLGGLGGEKGEPPSQLRALTSQSPWHGGQQNVIV